MIKIPTQLEQRLKNDPQLYAGVLATSQTLSEVLQHSKLPFFPDYTDHGINHIENVLLTADALILESSWTEFTPADAAVLIISVLLHDLALHLSEDGFKYLMEEGSGEYTVPGLSDVPWKQLWQQFLSEARRMDGRQLTRLFGKPLAIRIPPVDPLEFTLQDRLLIGEFIRRHHHRLAHEFALFGIPGGKNSSLKISELLHPVADLAGLIARSHGVSIRSTMRYLGERYDVRQFKGVHAIYLMALIRVADYVQVDAGRAPESALSFRQIRSPISQLEWRTHHSVLDIRHTHDDPEALYIHAAPQDAKAYLRLKQWLSGIQLELDTSWAILGEVYGRLPALSKLGLLLRRVRSNLDDPEAFAKTVSFVPMQVRFDVADSDLLKLLIKPLYGNDATVGVRELLQNAVDAVRERRHWESRDEGQKPLAENEDAEILIKVKSSDDGVWIEVADIGIGMDATIVTQYFLRAGASFRRSQAWRTTFEDSQGNSLILRSGRFGIGVLAAFLLGDQIEVSTRHIAAPENEGIRFTASVDDDTINMVRVTRDVGTSIRVRLSNEALEQLTQIDEDSNPFATGLHGRWDWYCLDRPKVVRWVGEEELPQAHRLPNPNAELPLGWSRIEVDWLQDVHWTFAHCPKLVVNGISVAADSIHETLWEGGFYGVRMPRVSVFDPDGRLSLTLQRDDLEDGFYPFHDQLRDDVIAGLLRDIVDAAPTVSPFAVKSLGPLLDFKHPAIFRRNAYVHSMGQKVPLVATNSGVTLFAPALLRRLRQRTLILLPESFPKQLFPLLSASGEYALYPDSSVAADKARSWVRFALGYEHITHFGRSTVPQLPIKGRRVFLHKEQADRLRAPSMMKSSFVEALDEEWCVGNWLLLRMGECPAPSINFEAFAKQMNEGVNKRYRTPVMAEWYLADAEQRVRIDPVAAAWRKYFRRAEIPYSHEARIALAKRGGLL